MPCEDLFDWWTLRCGVWVVFLLALLGNGTVVFVLVFARSKMDVPRFLVCNLAAADFFMGVYLGGFPVCMPTVRQISSSTGVCFLSAVLIVVLVPINFCHDISVKQAIDCKYMTLKH